MQAYPSITQIKWGDKSLTDSILPAASLKFTLFHAVAIDSKSDKKPLI